MQPSLRRRRRGGARHFVLASLITYIALASQILSALVVLPVGVRYFGPREFGIWLALSTLATYLNQGNLGILAATTTAVAQTRDRDGAGRITAQALRFLTAAAALLLVVGTALWFAFPGWLEVLFGPRGATADVRRAVAVTLLGNLLLLPLAVAGATFAGLQRVVAQQTYQTVGALARPLALLVTVLVGGGLTTLALLSFAAAAAIALAALIHLLVSERLRLAHHLVRDVRDVTLLRSGLRFFVLQLELTIVTNSDSIVISSLLGPEAVVPYVAVLRVFQLVTNVVYGFQGPLWPAYGDAYAAKDWAWMSRAYQRVTAYGLILSGAGWIGITLVLPDLIPIWLGDQVPVHLGLVAALGAFTWMYTYVSASGVLLSSMDRTRSQAVSYGYEAVLNVVLSVLLARAVGITGVAVGTLVAAAAGGLWLLPRDVTRSTGGRVQGEWRAFLGSAAYVVPLALLALLVVATTGPLATAGLGAVLVGAYVGLAARQFSEPVSEVVAVVRRKLTRQRTGRKST